MNKIFELWDRLDSISLSGLPREKAIKELTNLISKIYLIARDIPGDFQPGELEVEHENFWLDKNLAQAECDKRNKGNKDRSGWSPKWVVRESNLK